MNDDVDIDELVAMVNELADMEQEITFPNGDLTEAEAFEFTGGLTVAESKAILRNEPGVYERCLKRFKEKKAFSKQFWNGPSANQKI